MIDYENNNSSIYKQHNWDEKKHIFLKIQHYTQYQ